MSQRPPVDSHPLSSDEAQSMRTMLQAGTDLMSLNRSSQSELLTARTAKLQWHLATWKELQTFAQGGALADGFQMAGRMVSPAHGAPLEELNAAYEESLARQLHFLGAQLG